MFVDKVCTWLLHSLSPQVVHPLSVLHFLGETVRFSLNPSVHINKLPQKLQICPPLFFWSIFVYMNMCSSCLFFIYLSNLGFMCSGYLTGFWMFYFKCCFTANNNLLKYMWWSPHVLKTEAQKDQAIFKNLTAKGKKSLGSVVVKVSLIFQPPLFLPLNTSCRELTLAVPITVIKIIIIKVLWKSYKNYLDTKRNYIFLLVCSEGDTCSPYYDYEDTY